MQPCCSRALRHRHPAGDSKDLSRLKKDLAADVTAPNSWLALVALQWLAEGETTVGSAPDNKLHLAHLPAHAFILRQTHGQVSLLAPASGFSSCLAVNSKPMAPQTLRDDNAADTSVITCGGTQAIVIKRGDRLYLRVSDAQNPARLHFAGFRWYPENPVYRIAARWVPYDKPHDLHMSNVLGDTLPSPTPGYAEFSLDSKTYRLEPGASNDGLFFVFRDLTSQSETYGAGRFLRTSLPDHGVSAAGTVVLDFNQAYNPPCAFTIYATCPLPPRQNRLQVRIPAGEKRYNSPYALARTDE